MNHPLQIVNDTGDGDAIIKAESLPALTGNGSEDLLCGSCGEVLAAKLTQDAIAHSFRTDKRLVLRCTCGADNLVANNERPTSLQ